MLPAISAVYFYVEAARRTYLIADPYLRTCQGAGARAFLIQQLQILEPRKIQSLPERCPQALQQGRR